MKLSRLSAVSAFARPEEHLTRQTLHGAIVTLLGALLAGTLFCHELAWFLDSKGSTKMEVDLKRRHDLDIHVDITFHAVPCAALSVDVIDASGTADSDVNNARGVHLHKVRLNSKGRRKGGEYETPQSQTVISQGSATIMNVDLGAAMSQMKDMEEELGAHEGCRLRGSITVRRVAGRLHFAVHQQSFIDILPQMLTGHVIPRIHNMSHTVHRVSFGPSFPGQVNSLDGTVRIEDEKSEGHAYKYYIKIVPTEYTSRMGAHMETSQYSCTEYALPLVSAMGRRDAFVDLVYDLSPIVMHVRQSPLGLLHFVVRLCAVVGGALSVTRLMDLLVDGAVRAFGLPGARRRSSAASGRGGSQPLSLSGGGGLLPTRSGSHPGGGGPLSAATSVSGGLGPMPQSRLSGGGSGLFAPMATGSPRASGLGPPLGSFGSGGGLPSQPLGSYGSWQQQQQQQQQGQLNGQSSHRQY